MSEPTAATDHIQQPQLPEGTYQPAAGGDLRSPCPGLNALANHGYLPRDGKDITMTQLRQGLQKGCNFSYSLSLALAVTAITHCGSVKSGKFSLDQLALHNSIEHDASLFHDDTQPNARMAPGEVNPALVDELTARSSDGVSITVEDLIKHKLHRESASVPLGARLYYASLSEASVLVELIGDGVKIQLDKLRQFVLEERLPEGFRKEKVFGWWTLFASMKKLQGLYTLEKKASKSK